MSELERKGYFGFVRQGMYVMDQVVTSFSEEDVKQLGDNVVLILNTVKALTQPEMMTMLNNLTQGFHDAESEAQAGQLDIGMFGLLKQMRDPEVRRGLAITLETLRRVSAQAPKGVTSQSDTSHRTDYTTRKHLRCSNSNNCNSERTVTHDDQGIECRPGRRRLHDRPEPVDARNRRSHWPKKKGSPR